ncbi:hypothetical protein HOD29_04380 [archaeon]|jgi:hypothetical protein|nr:hypothetical protein [archaeon]
MKRINVLVDFGESFTDTNGSFYSGTTDLQKRNAVKINSFADQTIYLSDIHTRDSLEFLVNGGLYPTHNLINGNLKYVGELGVKEDQTVSPQLTQILYDAVKDKSSGLIVPRHVFFQDYNGEKDFKPSFNFQNVEETFGVKALNSEAYLDGAIEYVVNAKHLFNGAVLQATDWMGNFQGIPNNEMNIFSLLKQKYGQGKDLEIDINGVVMGICVYQTATGIRQLLPQAKINVIADASTHLVYEPLGFKTETESNEAVKRMCTQVGINYLTTEEYLKK